MCKLLQLGLAPAQVQAIKEHSRLPNMAKDPFYQRPSQSTLPSCAELTKDA